MAGFKNLDGDSASRYAYAEEILRYLSPDTVSARVRVRRLGCLKFESCEWPNLGEMAIDRDYSTNLMALKSLETNQQSRPIVFH